jgi:hypothetical protein
VLTKRQLSLEMATNTDAISTREIQARLDEIVAPLSDLASTWETLPVAKKRRFHQYVLPVGFVAGESRTADLGFFSGFSAV